MNIYQSIYDLINTYVYGGEIVAGSYMELVAILFSTAACLFLMALPFIVVWRIIKLITG